MVALLKNLHRLKNLASLSIVIRDYVTQGILTKGYAKQKFNTQKWVDIIKTLHSLQNYHVVSYLFERSAKHLSFDLVIRPLVKLHPKKISILQDSL